MFDADLVSCDLVSLKDTFVNYILSYLVHLDLRSV